MSEYSITVTVEDGVTGHKTVRGFVMGNETIVASNYIQRTWTIGSSRTLPSDFEHAKAITQCMQKVIEEVERLKSKDFKRGDRVYAGLNARFHRGAKGTVEFVEPGGGKVWVLRDGSNGPVYYAPAELEFL